MLWEVLYAFSVFAHRYKLRQSVYKAYASKRNSQHVHPTSGFDRRSKTLLRLSCDSDHFGFSFSVCFVCHFVDDELHVQKKIDAAIQRTAVRVLYSQTVILIFRRPRNAQHRTRGEFGSNDFTLINSYKSVTLTIEIELELKFRLTGTWMPNFFLVRISKHYII